jgi:hypothetical protein
VGVAEWIYFIHPPRESFAATMTDEEKSVWRNHFGHLQQLLAAVSGVTVAREA